MTPHHLVGLGPLLDVPSILVRDDGEVAEHGLIELQRRACVAAETSYCLSAEPAMFGEAALEFDRIWRPIPREVSD